jgi:hypothetical protein
MAVDRWADGRRVVIEDDRRDGHWLRTTWHAERGVFVISHWADDVCVAATRIPVEAAAELIEVLVNGLASTAVHRGGSAPLAHPPIAKAN